MEWLNYHHLLYFWTVAKEGGIARAGEKLSLTQATISAQISAFERNLGEKLFNRAGRRLVLTETGRVAFRYADEIFTLGRELMDTLKGRPTGQPLRFRVGIADVLPKLIAQRLLEPAFQIAQPLRIMCHEGKTDSLLAQLILHELDLVLTDSGVGSGIKVKTFNHLLGECGLSIFAAAKLAAHYRRRFPRSLDGAPFLLPTDNTAMRRSLNQWFDNESIRPVIVGEFEDSALLKVFGQLGKGLFAAPSAIDREVEHEYGVRLVGRLAHIRERFYAISVERRLKHPAVIAICESAKNELFVQAS
jgi:LysR family transcriptional regulator, transcriptional activator of nhaA